MNTKQAMSIVALWLAAAATTAVAAEPAKAAKPLTLRVQHELSSLGADGVRRDATFTERVYRASETVWIEREIPHGAHDEAEHAKADKGHKHLDTAAAARWIERQPSGKLSVRLVSDATRTTYEVNPAEYENIGFDGSWATAYHLLDPALLKTMTANGSARDGVQEYRAKRGNEQVTVQWDVAGQYPRLVQSRNASGTQKKVTRVTAIASPQAAPWSRTKPYVKGEYTDLMD